MGDTHPDQAAGRQLADQQKSGQAVVHLALEAPIPYTPLRYAVEDIEVDGTLIRRGDPTPVGFGAAGRDPAQHGDTAAKFDITRVAAPHLTFGYGVHHCPGAPPARLEAEVALPALSARSVTTVNGIPGQLSIRLAITVRYCSTASRPLSVVTCPLQCPGPRPDPTVAATAYPFSVRQ
ncbi:cytochrome P450 [Amycolatopsis sp. Hca4]|uniref:cytochrome P450 n=1 Tax=Amycolatopsis sp. Hca4 TaxID=2742131 RepID=UPI0026DF40B1|nr:cytochrome P450 [Amycolatopsis sp. Hca4]